MNKTKAIFIIPAITLKALIVPMLASIVINLAEIQANFWGFYIGFIFCIMLIYEYENHKGDFER